MAAGPACQLRHVPDGKYLAAGNDYGNSGIRLWELPSGKVLCDLEGRATIARSPRSFPRWQVSGGGGFDSIVYIWEIDTGRELPPIKFKDNKGNQFGSDQVRVAFAPTARPSPSPIAASIGSLASQLPTYRCGKSARASKRAKRSRSPWAVGSCLLGGRQAAGGADQPHGAGLAPDNGKEVRALDVGANYYNLLPSLLSDGRTLAVAAQGGGYRGEIYDVSVWELASGHQRQILRGIRTP